MSKKDVKRTSVLVNPDHINLVIAALLFNGSADLCVAWKEEDYIKLVDIAEDIIKVVRLNSKTIDLSFLSFCGSKFDYNFENPNMVKRVKKLIKLAEGK